MELLQNAIAWAETLVQITDQDKRIIFATKQNLIYHNNEPWTRSNDSECDVTIGSWDGAEVGELVGLFLLSKLQLNGISCGLYRDDGLALTRQRPQQVERLKKQICQIFRENGLSIPVEANKKVVHFLDVTLDLNNGSYKPYQKPNSPLVYVDSKSKPFGFSSVCPPTL